MSREYQDFYSEILRTRYGANLKSRRDGLKTMKLSVLMSVYDRESPAYLRECLDSLVMQTLPADEVVVVEDGPLGEQLKTTIAQI